MKSNYTLIIDFDSTIISLETLEFIGLLSLKKKANKKQILNKISLITNQAMNGEISFTESITQRLNLLEIEEKHFQQSCIFLESKIDSSFLKNLNFFKKNLDNIFIISGGFKVMIDKILLKTTNLKWKIYANDIHFDARSKFGKINLNNPLAHSKGKVEVVKKLKAKNKVIVVGDGYTDYEIKKYGQADYFLAFTKYAKRDNVVSKADKTFDNFDDTIDFLKSI